MAVVRREEEAAGDEGPATWIGRRDRTLLLVAVQTGLRNAELRALRRHDVDLRVGPHVRCIGKGRKTRCTPLRRDVADALDTWLTKRGAGSEEPVFPSARGVSLSADALEALVARHVAAASATCPSLVGRSITPHTLRHTAAMDLLRGGVDLTVIALWLGYESIETTQMPCAPSRSLIAARCLRCCCGPPRRRSSPSAAIRSDSERSSASPRCSTPGRGN